MQEKTRLKFKIVSSLLMCVLSLFSIISLTLSWFAFNDKTQSNGMNIAVEDDNDIYPPEYYRVDETDGEGYTLEQLNSPTLDPYSVLEGNYQLVIKIRVKNPNVTNLSITATTSTDYFLGDGTPEHALQNPDDEGNNVLSSVIAFAEVTPTLTEDVYSLSALPEESDYTRFITFNENEAEVTQNITVLESQEETVFLLLTYDPSLMEIVISANIGNEVLEMPENIPFTCDFSIKINAETEETEETA